MPTTITRAAVTPTHYLSLEIAHTPTTPAPTGFLVTIDAEEIVQDLVPELGVDLINARYYLPRIKQLEPGEIVLVSVTPLVDLDPIGPASEQVEITAETGASPEVKLRSMVADSILASDLSYEGRRIFVKCDKFGQPKHLGNLVGTPGAVLEIGVPYMTSENPFANSTDADASIVIPLKVFVKGDDMDRAEDVVNVARIIRGALLEDGIFESFGICNWTWSGGRPTMKNKLVSVEMTMSMDRASYRGE